MPPEKSLFPTRNLAAALGLRVRSLRHQRGLTQKGLADLVHVSANRIAQIEAGTDPAPLPLLEMIDAALRADGELLDLNRHVSNPAYENYAERFLMRQAQAAIIQESSMIIPGLLQTEDYMRALFESGNKLMGDVPITTKMATRLARKERLLGDDAPWYRVLLLEPALCFNVGGPKVMWHQLAYLLEAADLPKVDIQVVPLGAIPPEAMAGSFSLLTLPNGARSAYSDGIHVGRYFEKPADVEMMTVLYDRVQAAALSPEMSAEYIRHVMEERHTWDLPPLT